MQAEFQVRNCANKKIQSVNGGFNVNITLREAPIVTINETLKQHKRTAIGN